MKLEAASVVTNFFCPKLGLRSETRIQSVVCCINSLLHQHPAREGVRGRSGLKKVHWTFFAGQAPPPLTPRGKCGEIGS